MMFYSFYEICVSNKIGKLSVSIQGTAKSHVFDCSMQVGFTTLREFVSQRVPLRQQAMNILLDLTTHPGKSPIGLHLKK